jgi:Tfp pilus tip-associated adhesin PilY1
VASICICSRNHYALDVTVPTNPRFMWEWLGDVDGWRKGLSTGTPIITTVYDAGTRSDVPVVVWSSGTLDADDNIPARPRWPVPSQRQGNISGVGARWYMFNLLNPPDQTFSQVGYEVDQSLSPYTRGRRDARYLISDAAGGLFGTPAAVDYDEDGNTDALYIGSRHGTLFKMLIDHGDLSRSAMESIDTDTGKTCVFHAPPEIVDLRDDVDDNQAVYYRPSVSRDTTGRIRVTWGTGWPGNVAEPYDTGYMYSVTDGEYAGDEWSCNESTASACGPAFDPFQLEPGEKLVGPVLTHAGRILFTTYVADNADAGPACGVGHARVYALTLDACLGGYQEGRDWGPSNFAVTDGRFVEVEGIPSRMSFANQGIYLSVVLPDGSMDTIGPIRPEAPELGADRVAFTNWRTVL